MVSVIDSSVWMEYFTNGPLASKCASLIESASPKNFFTPTIVIYEVYKNVKRESGREAAIQVVAQITARTTLIQLFDTIAIKAAEVSLAYELKMADAIIKATADDLNATLVTLDSDFKNLPNVNLIR
ncbi:MAG: type II toxin-antitoxin system VapC family toxin [Candidatus Micrarchaeota archaeon]